MDEVILDSVFASGTEIMGFKLFWNIHGTGFGHIDFYQSAKMVIRSEAMGKEFVKEMLCKMVDDAELEE